LFEKKIFPVKRRKKNINDNNLLNISDVSPTVKILDELKNEIKNVVEYSTSNLEVNASRIKTEYIKIYKYFRESFTSINTTETNVINYSGYLCKLNKGVTKELWFQLLDKDLYCIKLINKNVDYKKKNDNTYKGMYNLAGIFLQEEGCGPVNNKHNVKINMYVFSLLFNKKRRYFLTENQTEYNKWVEVIRKAIGYSNLNEDYNFLDETIGKGKYGIVRKGIHKKTQQLVAIKIISKEQLTENAYLLVRNEIEILKISQHPNIIKIYNVYENPNFFYISNIYV
jgi:hypothetical protein